MPVPGIVTAALSVMSVLPSVAPPSATTDSIRIEFFDPFGRSSYQFSISEDAYIAVFEIRPFRVELTYPAIGDQLRDLRYGDRAALSVPDHFYSAGRHALPRRAGRVWSGRTENGYLLKGRHILVVASREPFTFDRLNSLFVDEGETFRRHNSLGIADDFTRLLIETIVPNYEAGTWGSYLHWIREQ